MSPISVTAYCLERVSRPQQKEKESNGARQIPELRRQTESAGKSIQLKLIRQSSKKNSTEK